MLYTAKVVMVELDDYWRLLITKCTNVGATNYIFELIWNCDIVLVFFNKYELYRANAVFIFSTGQLRTTYSLTNICRQISNNLISLQICKWNGSLITSIELCEACGLQGWPSSRYGTQVPGLKINICLFWFFENCIVNHKWWEHKSRGWK